MKYFKMIKDNEFIGAITSDNFICYIEGCGYMRTNEKYGEYVEYKGKYYRTSWMKAPHNDYIYTDVSILPISEDEYLTLKEAIDTNQEIIIDDSEDTVVIPDEDEFDSTTEFIRYTKKVQMSKECQKAIEAGIDVEFNGAIKHFTLTAQDQINLMNLNMLAQENEILPYHADGEEVIFYSADDIKKIVDTANTFKIYHTTYFNSLKIYIDALATAEEINAITYGVDIPEEYQTEVLKTLGGN